MKILVALSLLAVTAACASRTVEPSLGDSPVHEISCPGFLTWEMCLDKADRKFCDDEGVRLLHPTPEELGGSRADGQTVPVEGRIRRRSIVVMCEL